MKYVKNPTYTKYITGEIKRFNEDDNAFSRGAVGDGDLMLRLHPGLSLEQTAGAPP